MAKGKQGKTDWARLGRLGDAEIRKAVRADSEAAPIASAEWFRLARLVEPKPKQAVSIRLDEDILKWFRRQGRGYQTRMNAVLRAYIEGVRHGSGRRGASARQGERE
jgi:uncharacterized protein (DUF4415 family)